MAASWKCGKRRGMHEVLGELSPAELWSTSRISVGTQCWLDWQAWQRAGHEQAWGVGEVDLSSSTPVAVVEGWA